jgi:hypothetical protein
LTKATSREPQALECLGFFFCGGALPRQLVVGTMSSPGKLQRIGVKTEPATMRVLSEPVRAPGTIQYDERRVTVIGLRAESFIESVEDVTDPDSCARARSQQPVHSIFPSLSI